MDFLGRAATRIINEVRGINRVVLRYDVEAAGHDRVGMTGNRRQSRKFRELAPSANVRTPSALGGL
jgi:hypothetical protein